MPTQETYLAGDQPHRCDECGQCLHYGCKCCSECRSIRDEKRETKASIDRAYEEMVHYEYKAAEAKAAHQSAWEKWRKLYDDHGGDE